MAVLLHPAIVVVVAARSVPRALSEPVMRREIHLRVRGGIRATFFSMQSLGGRLAFSSSLALAASAIDSSVGLSYPLLSGLLWAFGAALLGMLLGLGLWGRSLAELRRAA